MKKIILLATIGLFGFSFNKIRSFVPPGTVQINDSLFADECEISNFAWQEYESWVSTIYGPKSKQHLAVLPDTSVWTKAKSFNMPYMNHYYRHPAYKEYPVVGITYEQAIEFCKWRTERVKTYLTIKKDFKNQNLEYKLPTKEQWEKIAETSSVFLTNGGLDLQGRYKFNFADVTDSIVYKPVANELADVTAPVKSYLKNAFGIYNILGNVAEMLQEKGISKGGAWNMDLEKCRIGNEVSYTQTESWLGFRCICIVRK